MEKTQSVEYSVKASFIEKFARFTEWKPNSIGETFVIGVLGKNPFSGELEKLTKRSKIKDKSIKVVYIKDYQDIQNCNVVFICSSEKDYILKIIESVGNSNIMLVGDSPGFAEKGVHFNFYVNHQDNLRYEVNLKALIKAGLKPDLQLISMGRIVTRY